MFRQGTSRWNCDVHSVRWRYVLRSYACIQQTHFTHTNTGLSAEDFRIVALDTGTDRPGLEKSTYAIRSRECKQFTKMLGSDDAITKMRSGSAVKFLSDIDTSELFDAVMKKSIPRHMQIFAIVFDTSILQIKDSKNS